MTLAARLAENPKISVAVVEAGTFYEISGAGNYTQIPAYETFFQSAPPTIDWGLVTTPQAV
jgi:choline dehydrogenase